ncbi:MAG TPA: transketolase [Candidatus Sulfotelmatobacter sp.]|nr:transketolase [Candidatus Sulfotelmatobacter sp.]
MKANPEARGPRLDVPQLQAAAAEMRAMDVVSIFAAGSGHPGGTLSVMDVAAALYLNVLNHDPADPNWPHRDRVFWSAGHKAPALYVALGRAGYFPLDDVVLLRQLGAKFEGHPNWLKVPGVEVSSGSLGQGLGAAVGNALAGKLRGEAFRVYVIMGDGEQQEGSVWEAAMAAGHYKLGNLCAIIDVNRLQIDGWVKDVMSVEPLKDKYAAFGWNVIEIDGHNMPQILDAFTRARQQTERPTVILARTVKGKGVSYMENEASWHGTAPKKEQFEKALPELLTPDFPRSRVDALLQRAAASASEATKRAKAGIPKFVNDYWWNSRANMKVDMDPTRMGFGRGLEKAGEDPRVVTLHADISGSIRITDFEAKHPERKNRVFSVGIAEQNMMSVAAGLSREGFIPVTGTYGVFASGRAWDQIRTTICYSNLNVKIAGAHGGISVGPDGATHQALEEITLTNVLPNMNVVVPCDSVETEKATEHTLLSVLGPCYLRFAREATPMVTNAETPFEFGVANVIRYRGQQEKFLDAFDTILGPRYHNEREQLAIIACGPMVPEAMRAAWILKEEYGIETRIVNVHTVKPLDVATIVRAADETRVVITAEEHQVGGFGNVIAGAILRHRSNFRQPLQWSMIGVEDRFGVSGNPWELVQHFGLTAEHIAKRALELLDKKVASAPAIGGELITIRCARCGTKVPINEYAKELPSRSDELCADCDYQSMELCAVCRIEWGKVTGNTTYVCLACRAKPVLR